jgi:hypothetical protein
MAAKEGGGSSVQGLTITLVIFILLTIILGVTTYLGYDGQKEFLAQAEAAKKKEQAKDAELDWAKFQAKYFRTVIGINLPVDEDYLALIDKFDKKSFKTADKDKEPVTAEVTKWQGDKTLVWNDKTRKPDKPLVQQLKDQADVITQLKKDLQDQKDLVAKKDTDLAALQKQLDQAAIDYADKLKQQAVAFQKEKANLETSKGNFQNDSITFQQEKDKLAEEFKKQVAELQKQMEALAKENKLMSQALDRYNAANQVVNTLDSDQPKGHVSYIDKTGATPFIDLGSEDRVYEQLTFSVYGVGVDGKPVAYDLLDKAGKVVLGSDGKPLKEGKGAVEVVSVIGPHLSQVRVTSLRDGKSDPIVKGDLLYNPVWDPNLKQHVAIVGLIDLSGNGRDEGAEFRRLLERQNVIIDAYQDLREGVVKGKLLRTTDYLILGDGPDLDFGTVKDEDPKQQRKIALRKQMDDMQDEAHKNGITVVPVRRFLMKTGIKAPKITNSGVGARNPFETGKPAGPPDKDPMKDPMKDPGDKKN